MRWFAKTGTGTRPISHFLVLAFNIVVVISLLTAGLGFLWVNGRVGQRLVVTLDNSKKPINSPAPAGTDWDLDTLGLGAKNFLLTGSDNGSCADPNSVTAGGIGDRTNFGERSDTIMIIRIDPNSKRTAILSFPRDLWVDIAGTTRQNRINSAFQSTDPRRLIATIEKNFQIPVDHYVNINFCAFKEIVTAVGGVKVPFLYPTRDKKLVSMSQAPVASLSTATLHWRTFAPDLAIDISTRRNKSGSKTRLVTLVGSVDNKISCDAQCSVHSTKDHPVFLLLTIC